MFPHGGIAPPLFLSCVPCVRGSGAAARIDRNERVNALARLESWLQAVVEGPARWLTGQRIQPVEIARRLAVAMDDGILVTGDRPLAPNRYVATLAEADYAPIAGIVESLQREFERFVADEATGRGYRLAGPAHVEVRLDTAYPAGRVTIIATHDAPQREVPTVTRAMPTSPRVATGVVVEALGNVWPIADGRRYVVGRDAACDIVLDHDSVSRTHAVIVRTNMRGQKTPAVSVVDQGSTNGTWVDGTLVSDAVVLPGVPVRFGTVDVTVRGFSK